MGKITRIRYKKDRKNPNILISNEIVATTGSRYKVYLNISELTYKIKNLVSESCYYGGENISNLNYLKTAVRNRLQNSFKVELNSEMRNRTFGVCSKGYTQDRHEEKSNE